MRARHAECARRLLPAPRRAPLDVGGRALAARASALHHSTQLGRRRVRCARPPEHLRVRTGRQRGEQRGEMVGLDGKRLIQHDQVAGQRRAALRAPGHELDARAVAHLDLHEALARRSALEPPPQGRRVVAVDHREQVSVCFLGGRESLRRPDRESWAAGRVDESVQRDALQAVRLKVLARTDQRASARRWSAICASPDERVDREHLLGLMLTSGQCRDREHLIDGRRRARRDVQVRRPHAHAVEPQRRDVRRDGAGGLDHDVREEHRVQLVAGLGSPRRARPSSSPDAPSPWTRVASLRPASRRSERPPGARPAPPSATSGRRLKRGARRREHGGRLRAHAVLGGRRRAHVADLPRLGIGDAQLTRGAALALLPRAPPARGRDRLTATRRPARPGLHAAIIPRSMKAPGRTPPGVSGPARWVSTP
ncbi:MAG: hypothetical protein MZV70_03825 [Desulfobacterales bacterium]|nr:hypothetical protein [Desulfobacterales bacterium]